MWMHSLIGALVLLSAVSDIRVGKIPNAITVPFAVAALLINTLLDGFSGFTFGLTGLFAGIGLLIIPYTLGKMGAGDVKLMGAIGSFLGPKDVFCSFLFHIFI